jgi:hypothetical protein
MNKLILPLLFMGLFFTTIRYNGGSTAPVILAGSIVKNIGNEPVKKYPRKNCPVCKGTGKYLSGDGIKMVDCGYCVADKAVQSQANNNLNLCCSCKVCLCEKCKCCKCQECDQTKCKCSKS